jgi:catalase
VRGIDFTEDPLLQGRIFSYLDTQINRHGGPNFEQIPINRPHVKVHNNNRDGAGQNYIHLNKAPYSPNTLSSGSPKQANQKSGNGFFMAPGRSISGNLVRGTSPTFADVWSQPRMFFNSLIPVEQQFLINAIRFEVSHLQSTIVKSNVIFQLNRVSNDLARRVADVVGVAAPASDPTYYNNNSTAFVGIFGKSLPTIRGLNVGILASVKSQVSLNQALTLATSLATNGLNVAIVGETLQPGIDQTYSAADATAFDGIVIAPGAEILFSGNGSLSTYFPAGRPMQILVDGYRWGKPIGALGTASSVIKLARITTLPGVYGNISDASTFVAAFKEGLKTFKFLDRFAIDP